MTEPTRPSLVAAVLVAAATVVALYLYWAVEPGGLRGWLFCWFWRLTGFYCPGCGSTRSIHLLLHGHLLAAVRHNLLVPPALVYLGWALWDYLRRAFRGGPPPQHSARAYRVVLGVLLSFWVLRNIPVWPLALLAPP